MYSLNNYSDAVLSISSLFAQVPSVVVVGLIIPQMITTLPGGTHQTNSVLGAQAEDDLCGPQHGDHGGGLGDGHGQGNEPEGQEGHDGRHQEGGSGGEGDGEGVGDQPVGEKEAREEGEEDREHAGHQHQVDRADPLVGLHSHHCSTA